MSKKLELIIPTLNEEGGIGETIEEFPAEELESKGYEVSVTIVDGGSKDGTRQIAKEKGAGVILEKRPGYGRAYKTGFNQSKADIMVTSDADASYSFDKVPEFVERVEKECDFLTTNRFGKMDKGSMSFRNRFGNRILAFFSKLLFGTPYRDSQSGMWVFKRKILEDLELKSDGMSFSEEIKIEAHQKGFRVDEFDIKYSQRKGERKLHPWRDGPKNFCFLFKKRFSYLKETLSNLFR